MVQARLASCRFTFRAEKSAPQSNAEEQQMAVNYYQASQQDMADHISTYNGFIRLIKITGAVTAATLLLMFLFLAR
jgi:hypothetical protein